MTANAQPADRDPSPTHTIVFAEGTGDVLDRCIRYLDQTVNGVDTPDGSARYENRADRLREALNEARSLISRLTWILRSNHQDRNVVVYPTTDGPPTGLSLGFRYDSGYTGAMIFWPGDNGEPGRWQIHT